MKISQNITALYNKEIELEFDAKKHHYTIDGKTVDGVTSILGVINKPALIYWSANMASEYINLNLPVGEPIDELKKKTLVEGCKTAHRTLKQTAADYGTLLHEIIEKYIKGEEYQEPTNEVLKQAFNQFLDWVKENKVEFKSSERKIYSKKYNYAGTCDFTAIINGKNVIGDIKTSSGIYDEMWLQVTAYKQALLEEYPEFNIDHTVVVRCGKDGGFEVKELNDFDKNIEAFVGALALYRRLKEMKFVNYINNQ